MVGASMSEPAYRGRNWMGLLPQGGEVMRDFIVSLAARLQVEREDGQAMVEYGLILALVSVVAIAALITVGGDLLTVFQTIATDLETAL